MGIFSWIRSLFTKNNIIDNIDNDVINVYYSHKCPKGHEDIMAEMKLEERDTVDTSKVIVGDKEMTMDQANKLLGMDRPNPKADNFFIPGQVKSNGNIQTNNTAPMQQPIQSQPVQQQGQSTQQHIQQPNPQVNSNYQQPIYNNYQQPVTTIQATVDKKSNELLDYVVIETDKSYGVCISLPGISKSEVANGLVNIDFKVDTLKVTAKLPNLSDLLFNKLKGNSKSTRKKLVNQEHSTFVHKKSSFATIKFSKTIDTSSIKAKFEDACLYLTLPILKSKDDNLSITIL
jgi:HSP20 family molecular chaperone IbpA